MGAALAPLDDLTVVLVAGDAPAPLAPAALGIAGAAAPGRRVAVFDIAGAFGLVDSDGLLAAFRDGRSLNALARPLDDAGDDRYLVPRGPGAVPDDLLAHDRWPRLVNGFRETGALLIVTVRSMFPGIPDGMRWADRSYRLIGDATAPALEPLVSAPGSTTAAAEPADEPAATAPVTAAAPPLWFVAPAPAAPRARRGARPWRRFRAGLVGLPIVLGVGGFLWYRSAHQRPAPPPVVVAKATDALAVIDAQPPAAPDTLPLPRVVNPVDSARAAAWGVELVATNDRADANFRLAEHGVLPAGTLSPILLGGDAAPWFKVVAGAFVDRTAAEHLRAELRRVGTLDAAAGVVARVPYALRLDTGLAPPTAKARAAAYARHGIAAYALLDDEGHATLYAGSFATPEQAVLLIVELRTAGLKPDLAFRVGRTY